MNTGRRGHTLIEVLVALTIFSMVVAFVMRFGDWASRRVFGVRTEAEQLDQLVMFFKAFSTDVRDSRQVLYSSPGEIGLWKIDENGDSAPQTIETVGYGWDGEARGIIYRQDGEDSTAILSRVVDFKLIYDTLSPNTRHVILQLAVEQTPKDVRTYHFSVNLRTSELN